MNNLKIIIIAVSVCVLLGYTIVGTSGNVDTIEELAPLAMEERGWEVLRCEGFQYSSWAKHGGVVWYHVQNIDNENIQYRVRVTLWNGELQWYYGDPEDLSRFEVKL